MKRLPQTVIALGLVSFFTDFSSEMIYPLLPLFLVGALGAGPAVLGVIEGVAESTAALLKLLSGLWADRVARRKPFIFWGYVLAGAVRPLIGLAQVWPVVLLIRFSDRIGKGLRTSPRDALIGDVAGADQRGAAFGFHRSMDHAGAVVGPLVAAALMARGGVSMRHVFLLAAIPAAIVLLLIVFMVHEPPRQVDRPEAGIRPIAGSRPFLGHWAELGGDFHWFLLVLLVFTLGNSTDAFLLLRLNNAGVPAAWLAVLWALHHAVKMVSTYWGGLLSDRWGRRGPITVGWIFYAIIYLCFAVFTSSAVLIGVFIAYGIYFGLTEPSEKAWVTDLVPAHLRGTAFGYYNGVIGLAALPASLLFGLIWKVAGAPAAFLTGAVLAGVAALMLLRLRGGTGRPTGNEKDNHGPDCPCQNKKRSMA